MSAARHGDTLRYWLDVESLTYPDIPKPGKRRHYTLRYADPLPWALANELTVPDHKYFVYFGLVQKNVLETELFSLFGTSADSNPGGTHERKKTGKTFLCAIEVSASGHPVVATLQLAAFAVAFAGKRLQRVLSAPLVLVALKEKITNLQSDSASGIADAAWFEQVIEFLIALLDWQPRELMAREQICVHRVPLLSSTGKPLRHPPEMDPINSFYVEDLQRICDSVEGGASPAQVNAYLAGGGARIDVTRLEAVDAQLRPGLFPAGRWPSKFPLFLMQQVAVNTALEVLADGGICSVNGPPGTGKTTLLMDVIAARIVERAGILASFDAPERAFSKSSATITYPPNRAGEIRNGPCFFIDPRLLDCGIVVASANNKAVENITRDLPKLSKVWPQSLVLDGEPFDYFGATAEAILQAGAAQKAPLAADEDDEAEQDDDARCWGLISVALGKKANRSRVADQLGAFAACGIQKMLDQLPPSRLDWSAARRRFAAAVERVTAIQQQIARFDQALPLWREAEQQLAAARAELLEAEAHYHAGQQAQQQLEELARHTEAQLGGNLAERQQYALDWPWWRLLWTRLINAALFREVGLRRLELEREYAALRSSRAELKRQQAEQGGRLERLRALLGGARETAAARERALVALTAELSGLRADLGEAAFEPSLFATLSSEQQQKMLPRSNAAYHQARAEVFVAALALHQAFMRHAGKPFETNLRLALSMLAGDSHLQQHLPLMARHLWATFFLVVPVVSSTFASVARCFSDLGEGEVGLLLVDEAGQAVPAHALGAIWRSRRALIVGDPLQVEPVINMDKKLDYEILKYHQAPEAHQLTRYSAQHLADRANRYGAHVRQYDGTDLWVGSPLRVHRRCVDPMFSVSNRIAYNDKMVFGPAPEDEVEATAARPLLGPSRWHEVTADDFEEHFSPAEGRAALAMLIAYQRQGWCGGVGNLPDVYVISPFKSVATEMSALLRAEVAQWAGEADEEAIADWLQARVGTVHTFQGKECETVIFILGGKTAGARSWAASSPNIINVAITRAKRRLYVIGNRKAWSDTRFGLALAEALD